MPNQRMNNYIKDLKIKGYSDEQIKLHLVKYGYNPDDLKTYFFRPSHSAIFIIFIVIGLLTVAGGIFAIMKIQSDTVEPNKPISESKHLAKKNSEITIQIEQNVSNELMVTEIEESNLQVEQGVNDEHIVTEQEIKESITDVEQNDKDEQTGAKNESETDDRTIPEKNDVDNEFLPQLVCYSPDEFMDTRCTDKCKVLIVIDSDLSDNLVNELNQYSADIKEELNYITEVKEFPSRSSKEDIKGFIAKQDDLAGVLLIGDIPTADYFSETTDNSIFETFGLAQMDFYYQDIDHDCEYDKDKDAFNMDTKRCINARKNPAFWISRITPQYDLKDRWSIILREYFRINHEFRSGKIEFNDGLLAYIPLYEEGIYSFKEFEGIFRKSVFDYHAREDMLLLFSGNKEKDRFLSEISKPYEFAYINAHGAPTFHQWGIISSDIKVSNALTYYISSCGIGRFTDPNYIAGAYLFNGNTMFLSASSIPLIAETAYPGRYDYPLTKGLTFLETEQLIGLKTSGINWLGDPTLKMRYKHDQEKAKICFSRNEINFGNIVLNQEDAVSESITIYNEGVDDLEISAYQLVNDGNQYITSAAMNNIVEKIEQGRDLTIEFKVSILQQFDLESGQEIVDSDGLKPGKFSGELVIVSNDPEYPMAKIPYSGYVEEVTYVKHTKPVQTDVLSCKTYIDCTEQCITLGFSSGICVESSDCFCS